MLADNLQIVRTKIASALNARTEPKLTGTEVTLVAVTKNHSAQIVEEILALGVANIGENRVQEAKLKRELLTQQACWHLIGHLQTNKAGQAVELFDLIESVDSEHLAMALNVAAAKAQKRQDILLQLNIAQEKQKNGFSSQDYLEFLPRLALYQNLRVRGLMVIAPLTEDTELLREIFRSGYRYFSELRQQLPEIDSLSMGMSGDFTIAIEEGANIVRVGTALFGARL